MLILTNEQMRWADARTMAAGVSGVALMAAAGRAVARATLDGLHDGGRVVIVAGGGNNGGDGYAAALELVRRGVSVTVVAMRATESLKGDAAAHARQALDGGVKVREAGELLACLRHWLARAALVVDAMFGTGLDRPLQGRARAAVDAVNACARPVLAVDMPSGISGDTGRAMGGAVRATWTLPVAATKWGHWLGDGREATGRLLPVADIGIPDAILRAAFDACPNGMRLARVMSRADVKQALGPKPRTAHKGDFGHVWIFGGSPGFTGAPRLAAAGAMAAGAGLVSMACPAEVWPVIAAASLEAMVHAEADAPWRGADVVVAGPGWGRERRAMLGGLLASDAPLVLDADALNMLAADDALRRRLKERAAPAALTPHPGEAARLLGVMAGEVQADRPAAALELARMFGAWVVLKGADSLVAAPDSRLWLCPFGGNRLARGGTGDVLAGVLGALVARDVAAGEPARAVFERALPAGVALHALAGEESGWHRAGQLAERIARLVERHTSESTPSHTG